MALSPVSLITRLAVILIAYSLLNQLAVPPQNISPEHSDDTIEAVQESKPTIPTHHEPHDHSVHDHHHHHHNDHHDHDHSHAEHAHEEKKNVQENVVKTEGKPERVFVKPLMVEFSKSSSQSECKNKLPLLVQRSFSTLFRSIFEKVQCIELAEDEFNVKSPFSKQLFTEQAPLLVAFEQDGKPVNSTLKFLKKLVETRGSNLTVFNFWREELAKTYEKEGAVKFEVIPYSVENEVKILEITPEKAVERIEKAISGYDYKKLLPEKLALKFNLQGILKFTKVGEIFDVEFLGDFGYPLYAEVTVNGEVMSTFDSSQVVKLKIGLEDKVSWRIKLFDNWSQYTPEYKLKFLKE